MMSMRRSFFQRSLWWLVLLAVSGVLLGGFLFVRLPVWLAPKVKLQFQQVGAYGPLELSFSEPMQISSVEESLTFTSLDGTTAGASPVKGRFVWQGSSAWFYPVQPLQPGAAYRLRVGAQALSRSGRALAAIQEWDVQVRQPQIVYLGNVDAPDLWRVSVDGKDPQQLTFTGGKVYDFAVSPDGNQIAYAARNDQQGIDLWEIDREGGTPRLLLPCAADWCINPAYEPRGDQLSYSRRKASGISGAEPGLPRVWLLDLNSLSTDELIEPPGVAGADPRWSPDGQYLSFYDPASHGIRVYNLQSQQDFLLPSSLGTSGSWSPDGRLLLYVQLDTAADAPFGTAYAVEVSTQQTKMILNQDSVIVDDDQPVMAPNGIWVAVARLQDGGAPGEQLWRMQIDGSQAHPVHADGIFSYGQYTWGPGSSLLLFQRFALGESQNRPQVALWRVDSDEMVLLAEDAALPRWLP